MAEANAAELVELLAKSELELWEDVGSAGWEVPLAACVDLLGQPERIASHPRRESIVRNLSIPLGYRLWDHQDSELALRAVERMPDLFDALHAAGSMDSDAIAWWWDTIIGPGRCGAGASPSEHRLCQAMSEVSLRLVGNGDAARQLCGLEGLRFTRSARARSALDSMAYGSERVREEAAFVRGEIARW